MGSHILRYLFAILFISTSIGKLLDNRGFAQVLSSYRLFPSSILLVLALTISLSELAIGLLFLKNWKLKFLSLVTLAINVGYLTLAAVTLWRGIALENCGCFGVFLARPLTRLTLVEDGILVFFSIIFYGLARKMPKRIK